MRTYTQRCIISLRNSPIGPLCQQILKHNIWLNEKVFLYGAITLFSLVWFCRDLKKPKYVNKLTGTKFPSEAQAVEVVTLAVFPPHLTKLVSMAGALSAQAVTSPAADRPVCFLDAVGIIRWTVILHWTLTSGAEAAGMTLTYATLVGSVTVAT